VLHVLAEPSFPQKPAKINPDVHRI